MAIAKKCDVCGKFYEQYNVKEAADILGLHHSNIIACCNGRRLTCGGLKWEYID